MKVPSSFLEETLMAWEYVRQGTIEEVRNIPAGKFDFRPAPEARSVRELIRHILEGSMLMVGELPRPDTNLRRMPFPKLIKKYGAAAYRANTKQELIALLRSQLKDGMRRFRATGDLGMWQYMEQFDGSNASKFQWFHHAMTEEMYHRGQIVTYQRLMGIEPALTKKIRAAHGG